LTARTQTTGGSRSRVSVLVCVKPAPRSRSSISRAALSEVLVVAPGQRGWDATAMRPPGVSRRRSSSSRSVGAGQNPRELTARMARKLIDRGPAQADPSGPNGSGVAPGRLAEHHVGVVDAVHVSCVADSAAQLGDGEAGTEADLENPVGGLHIEQRDHPAVALAVGGAVRHHPAGNPPGRAPGVTELGNNGRDHGPLHCHAVLAAAHPRLWAVTSHARDPSCTPSGVT
jgi:hypothetical protein